MWYLKIMNPTRIRVWLIWQEEEKLQHFFEEAIKTLQQKEPPRESFKANTQTFSRINFLGNFSLNIENQATKVIGTIGATKNISAIGTTRPTRAFGVT